MGSVLEDRAWLARVLTSDGRIVGAAFAIDGERLLTCAHVVRAAGASGPGAKLRLEFPSLDVPSCDAEVLHEGWAEADRTRGDIAVLRLVNAPAGMRAAPVRTLHSLDGLASTACGFPAGYDDGMWTRMRLGLSVGRSWVQMEVASPNAVEPGYSGTAIWSSAHMAVVAMMVTRDTATAGKVAFAIALRTLGALFSPLDLDPATATHWGPRSRGVSSDRDSAGWLFTGRRRVLAELVGWLTSRDRPSLRVVTGMPGGGKSAVLARLVTTADRHYRMRIPGLADDDPTVPPADAIEVTFHAKGQTVSAFVERVAAICDLSLSGLTAAALVDAVREAPGRPVIAVDAIDEATEPEALCALLNDLGEQGCRVLVACREHLLAQLCDDNPLRLDRDPYLEQPDIVEYAARLLAEPGPGGRAADAALVEELSDAAQGNFLVAQLVAQAAAVRGSLVRPLPRNVAQAFERLLAALEDNATTRELLLALAYAKGDGLSKELWCSASSALGYAHRGAEIDKLLRGPVASLLITNVDATGASRHRLFHDALAETLVRSRDTVSDQSRLWRAWTAELTGGGRRGWSDASSYLLTHGAEHAAAAGMLDTLAGDAAYLRYAHVGRLMIQLANHDDAADPRISQLAALLRLAGSRLQPLEPREREGVIALAALHLGLPALAADAIAPDVRNWRPRWAHRPGASHQRLVGHEGRVFACAIGTAAGRAIIASAGGGTVRRWDAISGEAIGQPSTGNVRTVAVSIGTAGGRTIVASCGDLTVHRWDALSGEAIGEPLTGHGRGDHRGRTHVRAVAIGGAGDRSIIVSGGDDRTVRVWDSITGEAIGRPLTGHTARVNHVAIGAANGRAVIVSADEHSVRVWDAITGQPDAKPLLGREALAIAIASGRAIIASQHSDHTLHLYDAVTGEAIGKPLIGHTERVCAVAMTSVVGRVLVASGSEDQTVRVWDATSGLAVGEPLTSHTEEINAVAIASVAGRVIVVSGADDQTVRLWNAVGEDAVGSPLPGHLSAVRGLATGTADGRAIIASCCDETVRLWDALNGQAIGEPRPGAIDAPIAIGQTAERAIIAFGSEDGVFVSDAISGQALRGPLTGSVGEINSLAFGIAADRTIIASGGRDAAVRIWDAASGQSIGDPLIGHATSVEAVALGMAAGRTIVASLGWDGTLRVWDVITGEPVGKPIPGNERWGRRRYLFHASAMALGTVAGRAIIVSTSGEALKAWDAVSSQALGEPLTGHSSRVNAVATGTCAGRAIIASASHDRTVRVWDAQTHDVVQIIHMLDEPVALALDPAGVLYVAAGLAICRFEPPSDAIPRT